MSGNTGLRCPKAYYGKDGWIRCRAFGEKGCAYQYRRELEGSWKLSVGYMCCPIKDAPEEPGTCTDKDTGKESETCTDEGTGKDSGTCSDEEAGEDPGARLDGETGKDSGICTDEGTGKDDLGRKRG